MAVHAANRVLNSRSVALTPSLSGLSRQRLVDLAPYSHDYVRFSMWELVAHEINERNIRGAVAELGVYQGRSAALLNRLFPKRELYLFDTFEGFDERDLDVERERSFSQAKPEFSDTSVEAVLSLMESPDRCRVRKGFFPGTAEGLEEEFAFVSIDTDLYQPILEGLRYFHPRLATGGSIFVHDYNHRKFKGANAAVREFSEEARVPYLPIPDTAGSVVFQRQG